MPNPQCTAPQGELQWKPFIEDDGVASACSLNILCKVKPPTNTGHFQAPHCHIFFFNLFMATPMAYEGSWPGIDSEPQLWQCDILKPTALVGD